jgi:prolyl-tRNA synthetase
MKASKMFAPTLREVPAEAEIVSHKLMLRAGMMRKAASGIYTYLPLAWRSLKKIENIIREEMDAAGGQELLMPALQPAEWWHESGRWDVYGKELWRVKDRHDRDFCLGPTHEEVITVTFRNDVRSYKQLPMRLYQIQTKFRDERRPRFGLMRGREFIMKDLYSFDLDEAGLEKSYKDMYKAYTNVFNRCGLECRPVEADSGAIGGSGSHEFMALAETGESEILYCDSCDHAATVEFESKMADDVPEEDFKDIEKVATPNCATVEDVAAFLDMPIDKVVKTMYYKGDDEIIVVLIRGDRKVNETKLQHYMGCNELVMATDAEVEQFGGKVGYLGPIGIKNVKIVADKEVPLMYNVIVGANEEGYHLINVNYKKGDFKIDDVVDLREVSAGESCPCCGGTLHSARGIEVGQIFKLHTKYSEALHAVYTDENGKEVPAVMGCYGIGVGRTLAAVIEQCNDEDGIIWPMAIAPYHVVIVPVNSKDENLMNVSDTIYRELLGDKVEVVLDDRKERPGVKFKDADLIGYPIRVTVGAKSLEKGVVEVRIRKTKEVIEVALGDVVQWVENYIDQQLGNY